LRGRRVKVAKLREGKLFEPERLIDVIEGKDEITVIAELAGFDRESLRIHLIDQKLTLTAKATNRRFRKSLNLPKRVIPETIKTTCKNGVLEIQLKKVEEERAVDKVAG
jgi:HSP20 family protein